MNVFINRNGVVRIGGRQQNQNLKFCTSGITASEISCHQLVICNEHVRSLHAGPRIVLMSHDCLFSSLGNTKTVIR